METRAAEETNTCQIVSGVLYNNGEEVGRLDGHCFVACAGRRVTVTWGSGLSDTLELQDAQGAASLAKECSAAIGGQLTPSTCISALSHAVASEVIDFAGRLAEYLWSEEFRSEALDSGIKRRRVERDRTLWTLTQASRATLHSVVLGVKERRPFARDTLGFSTIAESVRVRFPGEWRSLRKLQLSSTDIQDRSVALAIISQHMP